MIERVDIDGVPATVFWLTDEFEPAEKADATLVKIDFDDGRIEFTVPEEIAMAQDATFVEGDHPRDSDGKFSSTGGGEGGGGSREWTDEQKQSAIASGKALTLDNIAKAFGWGGWTSSLTEVQKESIIAEQDKQYADYFGVGGASATPGAFKSKKEHIAHLLQQPGGATVADILSATGWAKVSIPPIAVSMGLKLQKFKDGGVTKYKGTPMTPSEQSAMKAALAAKKVAESGGDVTAKKISQEILAQQPKPEPAKKKFETLPPATPGELEKAKKNVKLQRQYVPGAPQTAAAQKLVDKFNEQYEGKVLTTPDALKLKVADFKKLQADMIPLMGAEQQAQAKAQADAQAKAAENAAKQKAAQQAEAKAAAAANAEIMNGLGITEAEAFGFSALAKMVGGSTTNLVANFKSYEKKAANYGYPISGFQAALISNYSNGGYRAVNKQLRSGAWTEATHVYVKMVNKALAKMPTYSGTLNRGVDSLPAEDLAKYQVGHVVEERAFTSSSTGGGFGGSIRFKITAIGQRGASIQQLSNHHGESEVLFQARTFFKVTKVEDGGGTKTIHMTEMPE